MESNPFHSWFHADFPQPYFVFSPSFLSFVVKTKRIGGNHERISMRRDMEVADNWIDFGIRFSIPKFEVSCVFLDFVRKSGKFPNSAALSDIGRIRPNLARISFFGCDFHLKVIYLLFSSSSMLKRKNYSWSSKDDETILHHLKQGRSPKWIKDNIFEDEPLLNSKKIGNRASKLKKMETFQQVPNLGGSGVNQQKGTYTSSLLWHTGNSCRIGVQAASTSIRTRTIKFDSFPGNPSRNGGILRVQHRKQLDMVAWAVWTNGSGNCT